MMQRRLVTRIAMLTVSALLLWHRPVSAVETISVRPFKVNVASFANELSGQGDDGVAAIIHGARAWTAYGNSSDTFEYKGTTTHNGCGAGFADPHIAGLTKCPWDCPACDCKTAVFSWCAFSGWSISVFLTGANWVAGDVSNNGESGQPTYDLQHTVTHELGHNLLGIGHTSCAFAPVYSHNRMICDDTFDEIGWYVDFHSGKFQRFQNSQASYVSPGGWMAGPPILMRSGFGVGDLTRGTVAPNHIRDSLVVASADPSWIGDMYLCDYALDGCLSIYRTPTADTFRRPTTAYDRTRMRWWLFSTGEYGAPANTIRMYYSPDRVNWTSLGLLQTGPSPVMTIHPVAASYDPIGDRVVLVATRQEFTASERYDVYTVHVGVSGSAPTVAGPIRLPLTGAGAPAVECGTQGVNNCEILASSNRPNREIRSVRFSSAGGVDATSTLVGGQSADPVSMTRMTNGIWVAVVRAINSNHLYQNVRSDSGSWTGWQLVTDNAGVAVQSTRAPLVRANDGVLLDLLVVTE